MRLLTPTGYRDLAACAIGDEVCAWEIGTGLPIINRIEGWDTLTPEYFAYTLPGKRAWVQSYDPIATTGRAYNKPWAQGGKWYKLGGLDRLYEWALLDPQTVTPDFTYYLVNGQHRLFAHQSVWANDNVCHARDLKLGDTLYDDTDAPITIETITTEVGAEWIRMHISGDSSYIADGLTLHNADRYMVATSNAVTWDGTTTTNWSASDGGATGASAPTSVDHIHATAATNTIAYTITVGTGAVCADMLLEAAPSVSGTITLAGSAALSIYGSLRLLAGMTASYTGNVVFAATAGTKTITTNGVVSWTNGGTITFNGAGGTFQLADNLTVNPSNFSLLAGTFDPNGKTVTLTRFLGGTITGAFAFYRLTLIGGATVNNIYTLTANITVADLYSAAGAAESQPMLIQSSVLGTARAINAATVSHGNVHYMDITGAGAGWAAPTETGTIGDCLGNSGITFSPAADQHWYTPTTGTKTWSTAGNWFLGSGGTGGAGRVPLPQDRARFDASSIGAAGTTITHDMPRSGMDIDFTGVTNNPTFKQDHSSFWSTVYGSFTLAPGMTIAVGGAGGTLQLAGRGSHTINLAGISSSMSVAVNAVSGTYTAQGAATVYRFDLLSGTFNSAGNTIASHIAWSSGSTYVKTLTMGSSTFVVYGNNTAYGRVWDFTSANTTVNAGTSTVKLTDTSAAAKEFRGNHTYSQLWLAGTGSGSFNFTGSNTINDLKISDGPKTIRGTTGTTITVANFTGFEDNAVTLNTVSGAGQFALTKSGGGVVFMPGANVTNCIASPVNTFYAGSTGVDGGNNANWLWQNIALLTGDAAAAAVAGGALDAGIALAGVAFSSAGASGALDAAITLSGAAIAVSEATGDASVQITLSGAALAQVLAAGSVDTTIQLGGTAGAAAGAGGTLTVQIQLAGAAEAVAGASGMLTARVQLSGAALAQAAASGSLTADIPLVAFAEATATAAAALADRPRLFGYQLEATPARSAQYQFGAALRLAVSVVDAATGVATDPGGFALQLRKPDGVISDHPYTPDSGIVLRTGVGQYHADLALNAHGRWYWRWKTTTTPIGVAEGSLQVLRTRFP